MFVGQGGDLGGRVGHGHPGAGPGQHVGVVVTVAEGEDVLRLEPQAPSQDLQGPGLGGRGVGDLQEERPGLHRHDAGAEVPAQPGLQVVEGFRRPADAHLGGGPLQVVQQSPHDDGLHPRQGLVAVHSHRPLLHAELVLDVEVQRQAVRLDEGQHFAAQVQRQGVVVQQEAGPHLADERSGIGHHRTGESQLPGERGRGAEHPPGDKDGDDPHRGEGPHRLDAEPGQPLTAVQYEGEKGPIKVCGHHTRGAGK